MAGFLALALVLRPLPASVLDSAPFALLSGRLKQAVCDMVCCLARRPSFYQHRFETSGQMLVKGWEMTLCSFYSRAAVRSSLARAIREQHFRIFGRGSHTLAIATSMGSFMQCCSHFERLIHSCAGGSLQPF